MNNMSSKWSSFISSFTQLIVSLIAFFWIIESGIDWKKGYFFKDGGQYYRGPDGLYCMDLKAFNNTFGNRTLITFNVKGSRSKNIEKYAKKDFSSEEYTIMAVEKKDSLIPTMNLPEISDGFYIFASEWFPSSIMHDNYDQVPEKGKIDENYYFEYFFLPGTGYLKYDSADYLDYSFDWSLNILKKRIKLKDVDSYSFIRLLENSTICCLNCESSSYQGGFKTNMMMLEKELPLNSLYEYSEQFVKQYPTFIRYVNDQTDNMSLNAIQKDPTLIRFVKNQTAELKNLALNQNPYVLKFIENQTHSDIFFALEKIPTILEYVKNQTYEQVLFAITLDGQSLCYVKINQTKEMIIKALKNSRFAFHCVKDWDVLN